MRNKQLVKYMIKVFISYFLAIGIPICLLTVLYIGFTISQIRQEQYSEYRRDIQADTAVLEEAVDRIYNFSYLLMGDTNIATVQKATYEDSVYNYSQIMEKLCSFTNACENTIQVAVYVQNSGRIISPEFGVKHLEDFEEKMMVDSIVSSKEKKIYSINNNQIVFVNTLPKYYVDTKIVLLYYLNVDQLFDFKENLIIASPEREMLYGNLHFDEAKKDLLQLDTDNGSIKNFSHSGTQFWYGREQNSKLLVIRSYGTQVVQKIIFSSIAIAMALFSGSLLLVCLIAFVIARIQVKPVFKLSTKLNQLGQVPNGTSIFENISGFLDDLQNENEHYRQVVSQNAEIVKSDTIRKLIWGRIPSDFGTREFLRRAGIGKVPLQFLPIIVQTGINLPKAKFKQTAEMSLMVRNVLEEQLKGQFEIFGTTMLEFDRMVVLLSINCDVDKEKLASALEAVTNLMMDKLSLQIRCIIGCPKRAEDICNHFVSMRKFLNSRSAREQNLLFVNEEEEKSNVFPEQLRTNIEFAIKAGNEQATRIHMEELFEAELEKYPEDEAIGVSFMVISSTIAHLIDYPDMIEKVNLDIFKIFSTDISASEKYALLTNRVIEISKNFSRQNMESDDNAYISNAIKYIEENLDRDLPLNEVSQYVDLNVSYFSRLFKTNVGVTPLQYITQLRIDRAKELLHRNDLSIKDISEQLGYNDTRSFLRFFKKLVGCTPSEYRAADAQLEMEVEKGG